MLGLAAITRRSLADSGSLGAALAASMDGQGKAGYCPLTGERTGSLGFRTVEVDGPNGWEWWFEVGFIVPAWLAGDASVGWVAPRSRTRLWLEWSADLVTWVTGKFISSPGSPIIGKDGYEYWSRSILPVDSRIKTGAIVCASTAADGNVLNNPFTAITIADVVLALPNFPYTMPTNAAQLQTDLSAVYPGSTVVAASATDWAVTIPGVAISTYASVSRIYWPAYAGTDAVTGNPITIDGRTFAGTWLNSAGITTQNLRQFVRLGIRHL